MSFLRNPFSDVTSTRSSVVAEKPRDATPYNVIYQATSVDIGPSIVRCSSVVLSPKQSKIGPYYGTLLGSRHRWLCCYSQILSRRTPPPLVQGCHPPQTHPGDILMSDVKKFVHFCFLFQCDRRKLLITLIVRCVDNIWYDAKVEQKAGQFFYSNVDLLV